MEKQWDIAIAGGGIIGLAHAYAAAKKGYKVIVFEKDEFAVGASVRNFGLIWPIGQPAGPLYDRAMKSREIWLDLSKKAGFWAEANGSFHLAYANDEWEVIEEYHTRFGNQTVLMNANEVLEKSPNVNLNGLKGGLFSATEANVNPKKAIHAISSWLAAQSGVEILYGEKVLSVSTGYLETNKGSYAANKILICSGSDFKSLYPRVFAASGLIKSKLQMFRTRSQPNGFRLGPVLCGGLTLRHYASFDQCKSLRPYRERVSRETPHFDKWGIHVMVSTNEFNELIIGDSHEYGQTFDPFDREDINTMILSYLSRFFTLPNGNMLESWHGVYAKNPVGTEFVAEPEKDVKIITGFGGAGMTFSFGFASEEADSW